MAKQAGKKTASTTTQVDEIFSQLIGEQNVLFPGAAVSGTQMFSDVKIWVPTGSAILDTVISNQAIGGWPCGRVVEVYGQEAIGKSTLAFQAMANCQKMGGIPIYFDVEQAGSRDMMKACGVDMNRIIISGLTSIEEIFAAMEQNLTTIINSKTYKDKPIFIVLDSLAQMTTDSEVDAGFENNMNIALAKAKQIGKALRKISPFLRKSNACLYIVNQMRDKPGVMFGDPTTTPGGNAVKFAASVRIKLQGKTPVVESDPFASREWERTVEAWNAECETWKSNGKVGEKPEKPKKPKGDDIIVGYDVTARTDKNKVGPPRREAEFRIVFSQGIIEEDAWFDYSLKYNIIKKVSGFEYEFVKHPGLGKFKRDAWTEMLSDVALHAEVKEIIVGKLIRSVILGAETASLSDVDEEHDSEMEEVNETDEA
jgi:recombination protein RecA